MGTDWDTLRNVNKRDHSTESSRFFVFGVENMKTKLTFLLSLTFLFLFSGSVFGGEIEAGEDERC